MRRIQKYSVGIVVVLISATVAILVHAFLPSPGAATNSETFDGYLVQMLGFPFVASMYFVLLYLHIMIVLFCFGEKTKARRIQLGIHYGVAFGLMYLIGMQEVVVEGSPLDTYGKDFILYQLFMGLGDALPVVFLCLMLALCIGNRGEQKTERGIAKNRIPLVLFVALIFFAQRTVRYYIGFIDSNIQKYPMPVLIWTAVMGLVFGVMYLMLATVHPATSNWRKNVQVNLFIIGVNWIWFNCFMGLILKDIFVKMFMRAVIDVVFLIFAVFLAETVRDRHGSH